MTQDIDLSTLSNRTALLTLFATCEEMIHLAEKGEWDRVTTLEARRSRELVDFFAAPMAESESAVARKAITRLSALNDRLVKIASSAREETANKLKQVQTGSQAQRIYQDLGKHS